MQCILSCVDEQEEKIYHPNRAPSSVTLPIPVSPNCTPIPAFPSSERVFKTLMLPVNPPTVTHKRQQFLFVMLFRGKNAVFFPNSTDFMTL